MAEFAPLFPLETQFQAKDGRNNTAGWLKVFLAGTDDPAVTYSDYSGTRNPEKIVLDNNGRAIIICDKEQGYRLEVYDARGMLLWTEEPVFCSGTGGAGMAMTEIVSTDGSIDVQKTSAGGVTQFDIGLAPNDSDEFLEWGKGYCSNMYSGSTKIPSYSAGTITFDEHGAKLYKDRFYHITNRFEVKPKGTGIQYETFMVAMKLYNPEDGTSEGVYSGQWNIDTSVNDVVILEFSFDLVPSYDGELYWDFVNTLQLFQYTHAYMQIHRVYSGINAVPDTCATKQWISDSYQPKSGMSSYVPYSAIGHDGDGAISGINGSAIAGQGVSPVTYVTTANTVYDVSHILASGGNPVFVDSLGVHKGLYALVENWDREDGFKSFGRIDNNGLDSYATFWNVNVNGWESTSYIISDRQADWLENASNSPAYINNKPDLTQYQTTAEMTGYLPNSASGEFYPMTGNPSGFLTAHQDISDKLDVTAFTSYSANLDSALGDEFAQISSAFDNVQSALDSKLDKSASGDFYPMTGNPSGFITGVDLSPYQLTADMTAYAQNSSMSSLIDYSALEYDGSGNISGISGSAIGGQGGTDSATMSAIASAYAESAASSKLDNSASSTWYPITGNPSGFLTAHQDISDKLDISAFTSYTATALTSIENDVSSISAAVSGITGLTGTYVEQSAFDDYSADVDSALAGKADSSSMTSYMPYSSLEYSGTVITSIDGSAIGGQFDSSQFLPASASGDFYPMTGNPSGFSTTAYVDSSVSGKADASALTAYQPTGDYAYNSSLSGKLDESAFSTVSGSFLTAVPAGYATEAYVDSSVSGKQDTLTFGYENYEITSINGSAVGGGGGSGELFHTAVYSADTAMRSGHDTEFNIIYTPSSISSTAYATADTNVSASGTGQIDRFLAQHDTGGEADWYLPMGTGLVYDTGIPVYITASGISYGYMGDQVTARALTGYESGIPIGLGQGSGYLLNEGIVLGRTFYEDNKWSASGSGYMSALTDTYTGTATFAISKWAYDWWSDELCGALLYEGSAGASAVFTNECCVVPDISNKADASSLDAKLDKTAQVVTSTSTGNYTIGGLTVAGVSGINTKALLAVSAGSAQCDGNGNTITATYQTTAGMTAYQTAGNYQPSGDYIYVSALGWAEV